MRIAPPAVNHRSVAACSFHCYASVTDINTAAAVAVGAVIATSVLCFDVISWAVGRAATCGTNTKCLVLGDAT